MTSIFDFDKWFTHQHVHIQHPAVLSRADAEWTQVHAVPVVEHFIEYVTKLHPQLLPSTPLKLRSGVRWAEKQMSGI